MPKFYKKEIQIEAVKFTGLNREKIEEFIGEQLLFSVCDTNHKGIDLEIIYIKTLEGMHEAKPNDWIIKGIKGEFYPCKDDIFKLTYSKESEVQELKNTLNKEREQNDIRANAFYQTQEQVKELKGKLANQLLNSVQYEEIINIILIEKEKLQKENEKLKEYKKKYLELQEE